MKKYIKVIIPIMSLILTIVGCIKINIYNTKALSPEGNSSENFETVSNEFGEDFSEFIMDESPIKIYIGEENDGEAIVKIANKQINLTANNQLFNIFKPIIDVTKSIILEINQKNNFDIEDETLDVNGEVIESKEDIESNKEQLDEIIDTLNKR